MVCHIYWFVSWAIPACQVKNSTWSVWMICLICWWIQLSGILLRMCASMFLRDIDIPFYVVSFFNLWMIILCQHDHRYIYLVIKISKWIKIPKEWWLYFPIYSPVFPALTVFPFLSLILLIWVLSLSRLVGQWSIENPVLSVLILCIIFNFMYFCSNFPSFC